MRFFSLPVVRKLSGICLLVLACLVGMNAKLIAAKPNILFVLVDDQSPFDLKIYNDKSAHRHLTSIRWPAKEWSLMRLITWERGLAESVRLRDT